MKTHKKSFTCVLGPPEYDGRIHGCGQDGHEPGGSNSEILGSPAGWAKLGVAKLVVAQLGCGQLGLASRVALVQAWGKPHFFLVFL